MVALARPVLAGLDSPPQQRRNLLSNVSHTRTKGTSMLVCMYSGISFESSDELSFGATKGFFSKGAGLSVLIREGVGRGGELCCCLGPHASIVKIERIIIFLPFWLDAHEVQRGFGLVCIF